MWGEKEVLFGEFYVVVIRASVESGARGGGS